MSSNKKDKVKKPLPQTTPSPRQMRAAMAMLGWENKELSAASGVSESAIFTAKKGLSKSHPDNLVSIRHALEAQGIEFTDYDGVRLRPSGIEVYEGQDRFEEFHDYMYTYLEQYGGEVCISVTDERYLHQAKKDIEEHRAIMTKLVKSGKIRGRLLAAEGITKSVWAEVRHQPLTPNMPQVSFIAFGDNLALISFDHNPSPYVVLHKAGPFAAAYRLAFNAAWEMGRIPT